VNTILVLISDIAKVRKLVFSNCPNPEDEDPAVTNGGGEALEIAGTISTFDGVFVAYNHAIATMIDIVARSLEQVRPGSNMVRRAARRYRLFSTAVEQLGRERTFILGQGIRPFWYSGTQRIDTFAPEKLRKLGEILGARKILLGTSGVCGASNGDIVANSSGLLGTLIGHREPPLLSVAEIGLLESIEERVIACDSTMCGDEWYRTLTGLMTSIHSRIAIDLVNDMHCREGDDDYTGEMRLSTEELNTFSLDGDVVAKTSTLESVDSRRYSRWSSIQRPPPRPQEDEQPQPQQESCCCQAGLRKIFRR